MKRMMMLLSLVALASMAPLAQDEAADDGCDYAGMEGVIVDLVADLDEQDDPDGALLTMQNLVSAFRAECAGLSFDSETAGLQAVIGPVDFGEWFNLYKVTFTTEGYGTVKIAGVSGGCPEDYDYLFNVFDGQAADGAEMLQQTNGCTGFITVENATTAWTLEFEMVQ